MERGEMLLQVRGPGVLVPREIRWIAEIIQRSVDAQLRAAKVRLEQQRRQLGLREEQCAKPPRPRRHLRSVADAGGRGRPAREPGTTIARVARPDDLMAELRIAETQTKDVRVGQSVTIDTRNGIVEGRVSRIDPAVENGTVLLHACSGGARRTLSCKRTSAAFWTENVM